MTLRACKVDGGNLTDLDMAAVVGSETDNDCGRLATIVCFHDLSPLFRDMVQKVLLMNTIT